MSTTNDIRDIKGLVPVPMDLPWIWLLVAVLVAAGIIAFVIWRYRRVKPVTPPPPLPTPFETARRALDDLRRENPPVEMFYTRLSNIVRHYVEGQFGLHAPERTTEEFLAEAALPAQHMTLLGAFLSEADMVKFARLRPGKDDAARAFAAAERFVQETASNR
jgi:hypothetical protein